MEQHTLVNADKNLGEKSVSEGHNLFCHDCNSHCKMRKLNHLGMLEKTENFKLNATHNTRKRSK